MFETKKSASTENVNTILLLWNLKIIKKSRILRLFANFMFFYLNNNRKQNNTWRWSNTYKVKKVSFFHLSFMGVFDSSKRNMTNFYDQYRKHANNNNNAKWMEWNETKQKMTKNSIKFHGWIAQIWNENNIYYYFIILCTLQRWYNVIFESI